MSRRTRKLLIVEDDQSYTYLIKRTLERIAPELVIISEQTVENALNALPREQPDVVLLDLVFPTDSGLDFLKAIKSNSNTKRVPVIVFTGHADNSSAVDAYHGYANAFLLKPADVDDLQSVLTAFYNWWFESTTLPRATFGDGRSYEK